MSVSWTVYLMRAAGFDSVRDIPEGWSPPPLGAREAIVQRLRDTLPSLHFPRPSAGSLHGDGFSIELDLGGGEQTPGITLFVLGAGDAVLDVIGQLAQALDVSALASDLGDFMRFDRDPDTGRYVWRDAPQPGQWVAPA